MEPCRTGFTEHRVGLPIADIFSKETFFVLYFVITQNLPYNTLNTSVLRGGRIGFLS